MNQIQFFNKTYVLLKNIITDIHFINQVGILIKPSETYGIYTKLFTNCIHLEYGKTF